MSGTIVEILIWLILAPLAIGGLTAFRCRRANRKSGKASLSPHDRFEIKNDVFAAAAFFCPMALGYGYVAADLSLQTPIWWAVLAGITAIGCLPLLVYGHWHQRRLAALKATDPDVEHG